MNEELKNTFDKHFNNIDKRFDDISQEFKLLNTRLDKMVDKKETENEAIRKSLKRILNNLER